MNQLSERLKNMTPLQRAVFALQETQSRLDALEHRRSEPIAIVGMACRFPGGATDPASFWRLLCDGVDAIVEVPPDRWKADDFYDPDPAAPGKMNSRWGGFLERIDEFDNCFFAISDAEAMRIDPQQRMLLELAWEVLEDAGWPPIKLRGTKVGVFIGISNSEYAIRLTSDLSQTDAYVAAGTSLCLAANRVSFAFGLQGPSIALDTACSSALVAIHLACQHIRNGECDGALVGGTNLLLSPIGTINLTKAGFCAGDGRVRAFDAAASGYVRSEGAGMVMLKPLSAALKNKDPVYAVIRGSAVNQNGSSNGLTAPSRAAQEQVLREAYARARVSPGQVAFVEAQGTGTRLGDVIEATALANVLRQDRAPGSRCVLGAVKTNLGHLETASGVASLMKAALALKHRQVPPNVHFKNPNPDIPFDALPLRIPRSLEPWPEAPQGRFAGVSAFGFGGSNAHVVLEGPPDESADPLPSSLAEGPHLLPLSARTESAVRDMAARYAAFLDDNPPAWRDVCYTAAERREHHDCRLAVLADSQREASGRLAKFLSGQLPPDVFAGRKPYGRGLKIAFFYSDQTESWKAYAPRLAEAASGFAAATEEIDAACQAGAGWSLATIQSDAHWNDPAWARCALVALQLALTAWWRRAGVAPDAVLGQGAGELAAAAVAGILSLEEALRLAAGGHSGNGAPQHETLQPRAASLPFLSAVDGKRHSGTDLDAVHWGRCLGHPHRIAAAIGALAGRCVDVCLEVGPASLAEADRQLLAQNVPGAVIVPALLPRDNGGVNLMTAVGTLYTAGADLRWECLAPASGRCVRVPTYPWQRQRLWAPGKNRLAEAPAVTPAGEDQSQSFSSVQPVASAEFHRRPDLNVPYVAPRTSEEELLADIWREVLHIDPVGVHDNFFALGGHSLLATQVASRIACRLRVDLPLREMFQAPTIAELAPQLMALRPSDRLCELPPIQPVTRGAPLPASYGQEEQWVISQLQQGPSAYSHHWAARLRGHLNVTVLERSLNEIWRRHEILRTTFADTEKGLTQIVAPHTDCQLTVIDLSERPAAEREEEMQRYVEGQSRRPLDLAEGPLAQVELLTLGADEHVVLIRMHHIIYDGWSMGVLSRELLTAYFAFAAGLVAPLSELPIQYADFAVWQRERLQGDVFDGLRRHWLEKLDGLPTLILPTDRPRLSERTTHGAGCDRQLSSTLSQAIGQMSAQEGTTTFMTLLAAFQTLLHRYSGQDDFAVGTPVAGRLRPETENLIGYFINDLVLRADLAGDPSFRELLVRVRETVLRAFDHQEMPFMRLVQELNPPRDPVRHPLIQTELIFQNTPPASQALPGLQVSWLGKEKGAHAADLDLSMEACENDQGIHVSLTYRTDLFDEATIARMLDNFQAVLEAATATPDQPLSQLSLPGVPRSSLPERSGAAALSRSQPANERPPYAAPYSGVETQLAAIWAGVLRLDRVGVHDDFFEIGGSSLLAVRMMTQARAALDAELPVAALFAAPTVAALAERFETAARCETDGLPSPKSAVLKADSQPQPRAAASGRSLVPLRAGGPANPLFCIHGMGGHVASFWPLARGLTEARTVYGLQGQGLEVGQEPHDCIEDMAAAYLTEIREVQSSGPYLLAGWSMGGLIALETAQRLTAAGEDVALVAMFDSGFSAEDVPAQDMDEHSLMRRLAPRLNIPLAELKKLPLDRQWERIAMQAKLFEGEGAADICRLAEVCRAHLAALAAYSPEPYSGRVVLFQAMPGDRLDSRWKSLCPGLRLERVPGNHYTMLRPPHVEALAVCLGRCLMEAVEADEMARAQ